MAKQNSNTVDDSSDEGSRSFAVFLTHVREGELNAELSEALTALVTKLSAIAEQTQSKVKGTLALKLALVVDDRGVVRVTSAVTATDPRTPSGEGTFWITEGGNLSPENPRQTKLPLRQVAAPGPAKDVASEPKSPARGV